MSSEFFHGIKVETGTQLRPDLPTFSDTVIGLVGTAVKLPATAKIGQPFVATSANYKEIKGGTIEDALQGIYSQCSAKVVVVAKAKGEVEQGIEQFKFSEIKTGLKPSILLAIDEEPEEALSLRVNKVFDHQLKWSHIQLLLE